MGKSCRIKKQKKTVFNQPTYHRFSAEEVRVIVNGEKAQLLEDVFFRIVALSALVLDENFGKLQKKDKRIENYVTLLAEKLGKFTVDCPEQEKEIIEVCKRAGLQVIKDA